MSLNTFRNNLFELEHAAEVLRDLERFIIIKGPPPENAFTVRGVVVIELVGQAQCWHITQSKSDNVTQYHL